MPEKTLTNLTLPDLWKEHKRNFWEDFWQELEYKMKLMKKTFIEAALEEKITIYAGTM